MFDHDGDLVLDDAKPGHMHVHRIGTNARADMHDLDGDVRARLGVRPGELFLIRTDGYLAARVPADEEMRAVEMIGAFRPTGKVVA